MASTLNSKSIRSFVFLAVLGLIGASSSFAWTENAVSVTDPMVFSPNDFSLENASIYTSQPYQFVPGSLEWVRLDHEVTVPRARVRMQLFQDSPVKYGGMAYLSQGKFVEFPVVLLETPGNSVEIEAPHNSFPVRFKNTDSFVNRVALDSSCSPFAISVSQVQMPTGWAVVFCHPVHPVAESGYALRVDLKILWQGDLGEPVFIQNVKTELEDPILIPVAIDSRNSTVQISRGKNSFTVNSNLPARFRTLSVGAGIGPYLHNEVVRPFVTLYASYYLNEGMKLASFSAIPIGDSPHLDQGFYLITEQTRGLDDRLSFNLLLGAHFVSFESGGKSYLRFSAPQGIEFQLRDFLAKKQTLTLGTFYYPEINGRSYINGWIRYGWGSGFIELNGIQWKELTDTGTYSAKSIGISYGLPLFKAL